MKVKKRILSINLIREYNLIAVSSYEGTINILLLIVPSFFSTPFCENRYHKLAALEELCCFICRENLIFDSIRENIMVFSVLAKRIAAFLVRIRGPPSEI